MFSPGVCWGFEAFTFNGLCGSEVQALQINSHMGLAPEGFEPPGEVVGVGINRSFAGGLDSWSWSLVEVAFDGGVLEGAVHSFDLPIGPWIAGFVKAGDRCRQPWAQAVFEGVRPNELSQPPGRP